MATATKVVAVPFAAVLALLIGSSTTLATPSSSIPFVAPPPDSMDCASATPTSTDSIDEIGCYHLERSDVDVDVWTINRPRVDVESTGYQFIRPHAGDLVSVFAGGCVQHGGSGLTWKRYVKPVTPFEHDDSIHYGIISLPGVIPEQPLRNALPHGAFEVSAEPGPDGYVTLKYRDEGQGDNGYWGRDDGWWEQCFRMPDAFVVLVIQHGCVPTPIAGHACLRGLPVDLGIEATDDNGLPVNPRYTWQRLTGTATPLWQLCGLNEKSGGMPEDNSDLCRSPPSWKNTNEGRCGAHLWNSGSIDGHLNFEPVTYIVEPRSIAGAHIALEGHDPDDDYTLDVVSGDGSLVTENRPDRIQMEIDSDETIDHFASPWWSKFHDSVPDRGSPVSNDAANQKLANVAAIIIGLSGVDCEHGCIPELHPVYALALRLPDSTPTKEHWAYFARNWGSEGYCGTNQELLGVDHLTIRIRRPGAIDFDLLSWAMDTTDSTASAQLGKPSGGGGAWLSVALPPADQHAIVSGEFTLAWHIDHSKIAQWIKPIVPPWVRDRAAWTTEPDRRSAEIEETLKQAIDDLNPDEKRRLQELFGTAKAATQKRRLPVTIVKGDPPPAAVSVRVRQGSDSAHERELDEIARLISAKPVDK